MFKNVIKAIKAKMSVIATNLANPVYDVEKLIVAAGAIYNTIDTKGAYCFAKYALYTMKADGLFYMSLKNAFAMEMEWKHTNGFVSSPEYAATLGEAIEHGLFQFIISNGEINWFDETDTNVGIACVLQELARFSPVDLHRVEVELAIEQHTANCDILLERDDWEQFVHDFVVCRKQMIEPNWNDQWSYDIFAVLLQTMDSTMEPTVTNLTACVKHAFREFLACERDEDFDPENEDHTTCVVELIEQFSDYIRNEVE